MNCHICNEPLTAGYYQDAWDNRMCESHLHKDAVHCYSCTAFTKKEHELSDGRVLCKRCYEVAVKPGDSIETIKTFVIKALFKAGFNDLSINDISFEIVSAKRLAEIRKKPVDIHIKGYTVSNVNTSTLYGIRTSQKCRHTIYMLTHLTKEEFAGTLAHEMLHVWQTQNSVNMSHKNKEGFCNMGTYLVYSSMSGTFTKIQLKNLHESKDMIYGDGFREMYSHFERLGWKKLIENVRRKGIMGKYFPHVNQLYSRVQTLANSVKF